MEKINIDREWEFCKEPPVLYFPMQGMRGKETVNLPHDMDIGEAVEKDCPEGAQKGFYKGHYGIYTKYLYASSEWEGKHIFLQLDGVFCNAEITLNGHQLATHPNGYSPFSCELTPALLIGQKNRLAIFVNNSAQMNARWYSGSGIYRHAYLRVGGEVYMPVDPIFVRTESIGADRATLTVETEINNGTSADKKISVRAFVCEDKGRDCPVGKAVSSGEGYIYLPANSCGKSKITLVVDSPKLWDTDSPELYRIFVEISENGETLDSDCSLFGIRTVSANAKNGLLLNGKEIKIKGGCVHHDNGILGAKSFYDSEYRRMKLHKENGFNGIRCAHNPMSADMMEACDRLGLLVFAEAFDVWNMQKNINDYHLYFADWWERDLTAFIKRDRNHPCIFCWSIGNEIVERNDLYGGAQYSSALASKVRELDPTRLVTAAVPTMFNGMNDADTMQQLMAMQKLGGYAQNLSTPWSNKNWGERTAAFCAPLDFVGYNYLEFRYEEDGKNFPDRVICGTESYPGNIDVIWEKIQNLPYVIGDFVWTSQDYLGETGCGNIRYIEEGEKLVTIAELRTPVFPNRTANCGNMDLLGDAMPALHYRRIVWGSDETYIAVQNPANYGKRACRTSWAWEDCENQWLWHGFENKPIEIEVYSAAEEVELLIGGKPVGKSSAGKGNRYRAKFTTVYQPGEITAISYTNGKEVSRQTLKTPSEPAFIRLKPDKTRLKADGQSLAFVETEVVDKDGCLVPDVADTMRAVVSGGATLAAFGSANSVTEEIYTLGKFTSYKGRLLAVVRSGYEKGRAKLTVISERFGSAEAEFEIG